MLTSAPGLPLGAKPRVEIRPTIEVAYSLGDEAIELARLAGLELDPWQQDAMRLMLSVRPDDKWAAFEYAELVPRQNGKGAILEARALAGLFLLGEKLIMWSAHEVKTATEGFLRTKFLVENLIESRAVDGRFVKFNHAHGEEGVERLDTGQRLRFIARSKSSGRGFSGDVNLIDEAFAYTPGQQAALMPTMNARPNPQIVYTSSPPLDSDSGEVLFSLRARADAGGDDSLAYRDWGVAGDLDNLDTIDMDDRCLWRATNPAWGFRVTEETIARNRRSMGPSEFARELLGVWPKHKQGGGSIDVAQWVKLREPESQRSDDLAIGVDITPHRDYACIALYSRRADGLGHLQVIDYRPGTEWIVSRLVELRDRLSPIGIGMGRGTFASLKADLEKTGFNLPKDWQEPMAGDLLVATSIDMAAATGQIIDAVRQNTIRHLGDSYLDMAVSGAKVRETSDAIAWSYKDSSDISPLVAATVARYALESREHLLGAALTADDIIG